MKEITIKLTAREIDTLHIALCALEIKTTKDIEKLEQDNESGIHTGRIALKKDRIKECEALWEKLYDAGQNPI